MLEGYCHLLAQNSQFFSLFFIYWEMRPLYYSKANHSLPNSPHMFVIPFSFNKYITFPTVYNHFLSGKWLFHFARKRALKLWKHKTASTNHKCILFDKRSPSPKMACCINLCIQYSGKCETIQIENKSMVLKVERWVRWVLDLPRKKQHKGILA